MKRTLLILCILTGAIANSYSFGYASIDCDNANELGQEDIIVNRASCREYNLDNLITRQEVAAISLKIGEACGIFSYVSPIGEYQCENIFSDVSEVYPNRWACRAIETLAGEDIVSRNNTNRYGEPLFFPLRNITRAEALAMILDSAGGEFRDTYYENGEFPKSGVVGWQKPLLQYAYDNDIISSLYSFGPNTLALRREVIAYALETVQICKNDSRNNDYDGDRYYYNRDVRYCGMGQYTSGNSCYSCSVLPINASYVRQGSCEWQCNNGYTRSGNVCISTYNTYNVNYSYQGYCGLGQYYANGVCNSCGTAPINGYYTNAGSCAISCNTGYTYNTNTNTCTNSYYNPLSCGIGQYWSGNMCISCSSKPSYAYYTTTGNCDWTCNSGYYFSGNMCTSYYSTCGIGQYFSNGTCQLCAMVPSNAYFTTAGSCDWTCSTGYTKSGSSCVAVTPSCGTGQYASGSYCISCGSVPNNGYYTTTGSCDWQCNNGYTKSGGSCVANQSCGTGQYISGGICFTCTSKPTYAYYTTAGTCDWACNSGYYNSGNTCIQSATSCGLGEYYSGTSCYSCGTVPSHGYYTTAGSCEWSCTSGYTKSGGICISTTPICSAGQYVSGGTCISCGMAPANGYYTTAGSCDWSCTSGYYKAGGICVATTPLCSVGQYLSGSTCYSCSNKPSNSYYTTSSSCDWACNSGYYKSGSQCIANATSCGIGQYLSSGVCYNCSSKPSSSSYTTPGTCDWVCDSGYTQSGSSCTVQQPAWSVSCLWSGWYTSTTHGGSYPTGGKGNTMSFYCNSGRITAVSWNKGPGSVNTNSTSGITCNFSGSQAIDPQDFHGGSDEYMIVCDGTYLTQILARTNNWSSVGNPSTVGGQPTCTTSLSAWANGIGYSCTSGKVTSISKP